MEVKRGKVFLIDLNPVVGTEQAGKRPALVIQIDEANKVSPHTIIIPATSKIRGALFPSHVPIPAGVDGLDKDSVLLCEQVKAIDKSRLIRKLGTVEAEYLHRVVAALKHILGIHE